MTEIRRIMLTADAFGGIWQYSLELASGFGSRGAEVLLAVMGSAPTAAQMQHATDIVGVAVRPMRSALDWLATDKAEVTEASVALVELAAEWGAETIQLHAPAYAAFGSWPAPTIAAAHSCVGTWWRAVRSGPLPADLAWRAALTDRGLRRADAVIAPSTAFVRALTETYGLERSVVPIWNGRRTITVTRKPRSHGFTAGRLWDDAKNISTLNEAARLSGLLIRAAGQSMGPNGAAVRAPNLHLLGTLDGAELAYEYAKAGFFVSPAYYEPFGLAVLEAASAGCPLILGDIPTFRELWDGAAMFVAPNDAAELADAMRAMLSNPDDARRLGAAARERAARYTPEAMVAQTWAVHAGFRSRRLAA